jgi:hypothetical protein
MTLSCPSGYSLNPNKDACVTGKIAVNIPTVKATVTYTCPTGYVLNSYKTSCKNNRERVVPSTASYSCPASYTLSQASKTCTAPVRPGSLTPTTTYSCPEGYSFNADEKTCTGQTGMKEGVLESANSWSSSVVNWASSIF